MRFRSVLFPFLLAVILLGGISALPAFAQDEPAQNEPVQNEAGEDEPAAVEPSEEEKARAEAERKKRELEAEGKKLLERLDTLDQRIAELAIREQRLEGEDLQIARRQSAHDKSEYLEDLVALVDNVLEREAAGGDAIAERERATSDLQRLPASLGRHLVEGSETIAELREQREGLPLEAQLAMEDRIARMMAWTVDLLVGGSKLVGHMERMGIDATSARERALSESVEAADGIAGRLEHVAALRDEAKERADAAPDDVDLQLEISLLEHRRTALSEALGRVITVIEELAGKEATAEYEATIQKTGPLTIGALDGDVIALLIKDGWKEARAWVTTNAPVFAFRLLVFVLILLASRIVAAIVKAILLRRLSSDDGEKASLLHQMAENLTVRTIMLIGFLVGLSHLGIELAPLLAGLGIAGFIVGFALQDSLSNFAAGVMILFYRPFDIGDTIEAAGVRGEVNRMSLVSTTILTIDNQTLIVPNSKIWGNVIRNVTRQTVRRIDFKFQLAYTEDLERVEQLFMEVITAHPNTLDDPKPRVSLHEMGEYAMVMIVRPWVRTSDYWVTYWDLMRAIKLRLDQEGIRVPLPGRELHMREKSD